VLFTLLNQSGRDDFEHFVLFFGVEELRDEFSRSCDRLGVPFSFVRKRGRIAIRSHRQVMKCIRTFRPDVIMINGTSLAIPVLGTRWLRRHHDWAVVVRETQANHLKTKLEWAGSYFAARLADAVVYLTEEYRSEVQARIRTSVGSARTHVIPNGVRLQEYEAGVELSPHPPKIAMVSRLVPIKDHVTLIEAVRVLVTERDHSDLKLYIGGNGPTAADLEVLVQRAGMGNAIVFTGPLNSDEVTQLLQTVDIYVHCTFGETMSNSILQAMAARLPVVASDVKGVANLIRHGIDGLLIPVTDAVALADAIEGLLESPARRRFLGSNARLRIESEFSQERVVARYTALFEELASARNLGDSEL
jgi:glycosyltransferase involved in cell wall biosynthesis